MGVTPISPILIGSLVLLALSVLLGWFQDRCAVMDAWNRPPVLRTATQNCAFLVTGWTLGGLGAAGVWHELGLWWGVGALAAKLLLGRIAFHHCYRRAYNLCCLQHYCEIEGRLPADTESYNVSTAVEVQQTSRERIEHNMQNWL